MMKTQQFQNQGRLLVKQTVPARTKPVLKQWMIRAAILLIPLHTFAICAKSLAMPEEAVVPALSPESGDRVPSIRSGLEERLMPARRNQVIPINATNGNPQQYAHVPHTAWIHLKFIDGNAPQDPLIQASGRDRSAEYLFPCTLSPGTFKSGWGLMETGGRDACDEVKIARSQQSAHESVPLPSVANKQLPTQPAPPEENSIPEEDCVTVAPITREPTLVQIQNSGCGNVKIKVLVGSVTIVSRDTPEGLRLLAGSGYSTRTGEVSTLDCRRIYNSRSIESFLNLENWVESFRAADARPIDNLLKSYRDGFCQAASRSRGSSGSRIQIPMPFPFPLGEGNGDRDSGYDE